MARLSRALLIKFYLVIGLVRFRSPLLTESRLISFPPVTKMFQFTGFASYGHPYDSSKKKRVSPFRNFRVNICWQFAGTFRSLPRLSSPLDTKASTKCSFLLISIISTTHSGKNQGLNRTFTFSLHLRICSDLNFRTHPKSKEFGYVRCTNDPLRTMPIIGLRTPYTRYKTQIHRCKI